MRSRQLYSLFKDGFNRKHWNQRPARLEYFVLVCLTITSLVFVSYRPFLTIGYTGIDTLGLIVAAQPTGRDLGHVLFFESLMPRNRFYRPVSKLTYLTDFNLYGLEFNGYHLTDLFILIATSVGVVLLAY